MRDSDDHSEIEGESVSSVIEQIGWWGSATGGLLLFIAIVLFWLGQKKEAGLAVGCGLSFLAGGQAVVWIGEHIALLTGIALLLCLVYFGLRYRRKIVHELEELTGVDLNKDGAVGMEHG